MPEAKFLNCLLDFLNSLSKKKKINKTNALVMNAYGAQETIRLNLENMLNIFLP